MDACDEEYGDEGFMSWHGGVRGPEQRGGHQATSVLATVHVLSQQLALVLPEARG